MAGEASMRQVRQCNCLSYECSFCSSFFFVLSQHRSRYLKPPYCRLASVDVVLILQILDVVEAAGVQHMARQNLDETSGLQNAEEIKSAFREVLDI